MSVEISFAAAVKPLTGMAVAGRETRIAPKRAIRATRVILTCFMGDSSVCSPNARSSTKVPSSGHDAPRYPMRPGTVPWRPSSVSARPLSQARTETRSCFGASSRTPDGMTLSFGVNPEKSSQRVGNGAQQFLSTAVGSGFLCPCPPALVGATAPHAARRSGAHPPG